MKDFSRLIQFVLTLAFFLFMLIRLHSLLSEHQGYEPLPSDKISKFEDHNTYERYWRDYDKNSFALDYSLAHASRVKAHQQKLALNEPSFWGKNHYTEYWGKIYSEIIQTESETLLAIADSLDDIRVADKLNMMQFADVIVSFVQDIPYSYVHWDQSCARETKPCTTGQRFGIHTPTEFLYTLQGDCDTRALLLYGVMKHFGYDVRIAVSDAYEHAVLMVHMRSSGAYKTHLGKKYYFWETTSTGWKKGMLPPHCSDISKWHIAL